MKKKIKIRKKNVVQKKIFFVFFILNEYKDFWYNLSLIYRIIFTLLSLEELFFICNMVVQDILIFPGFLYDMENIMWIPFYFLYIIFM